MELLLKNWNVWWPRTFPKWHRFSESVQIPDMHLQFSTLLSTPYSFTDSNMKDGCSDSFGHHIVTFNELEYELETPDPVGSFSISSWRQIHLTDSLILFPHEDPYLNPQLFPVSLFNILSLLPKPINFL